MPSDLIHNVPYNQVSRLAARYELLALESHLPPSSPDLLM